MSFGFLGCRLLFPDRGVYAAGVLVDCSGSLGRSRFVFVMSLRRCILPLDMGNLLVVTSHIDRLGKKVAEKTTSPESSLGYAEKP